MELRDWRLRGSKNWSTRVWWLIKLASLELFPPFFQDYHRVWSRSGLWTRIGITSSHFLPSLVKMALISLPFLLTVFCFWLETGSQKETVVFLMLVQQLASQDSIISWGSNCNFHHKFYPLPSISHSISDKRLWWLHVLWEEILHCFKH